VYSASVLTVEIGFNSIKLFLQADIIKSGPTIMINIIFFIL
jgi:hypothetical protein